jgi:molybdopterin synthase sulfur carrier subunit
MDQRQATEAAAEARSSTPAGRNAKADAYVVRVVLPAHLRTLARVDGEVPVPLDGPPTVGGVLDAIEARYPVLRGAIREHVTGRRRPFVRFFACEEDLSHDPSDTLLPEAVLRGDEPFLVVGAMAGG